MNRKWVTLVVVAVVNSIIVGYLTYGYLPSCFVSSLLGVVAGALTIAFGMLIIEELWR